jgi:hypothetical protein
VRSFCNFADEVGSCLLHDLVHHVVSYLVGSEKRFALSKLQHQARSDILIYYLLGNVSTNRCQHFPGIRPCFRILKSHQIPKCELRSIRLRDLFQHTVKPRWLVFTPLFFLKFGRVRIFGRLFDNCLQDYNQSLVVNLMTKRNSTTMLVLGFQ